ELPVCPEDPDVVRRDSLALELEARGPGSAPDVEDRFPLERQLGAALAPAEDGELRGHSPVLRPNARRSLEAAPAPCQNDSRIAADGQTDRAELAAELPRTGVRPRAPHLLRRASRFFGRSVERRPSPGISKQGASSPWPSSSRSTRKRARRSR